MGFQAVRKPGTSPGLDKKTAKSSISLSVVRPDQRDLVP